MKCFCCEQDKPRCIQVDFLNMGGPPVFVCDECEEIARRGQKPMPQVEFAAPWVLAIERKRGPVGSLYGNK